MKSSIVIGRGFDVACDVHLRLPGGDGGGGAETCQDVAGTAVKSTGQDTFGRGSYTRNNAATNGPTRVSFRSESPVFDRNRNGTSHFIAERATPLGLLRCRRRPQSTGNFLGAGQQASQKTTFRKR